MYSLHMQEVFLSNVDLLYLQTSEVVTSPCTLILKQSQFYFCNFIYEVKYSYSKYRSLNLK